MTERIKSLIKNYVKEGRQKALRLNTVKKIEYDFTELDLSLDEKCALSFKTALENEKPVLLEGFRISFVRTQENVPLVAKDIWGIANNAPDFSTTISIGLDKQRQRVCDKIKQIEKGEEKGDIKFLSSVITVIDAIYDLADRYRMEALEKGFIETAKLLSKVPHKGADTFPEALQFLRILNFCERIDFNSHSPLGRFDQYMYPYLKKDLDSGNLDVDTALEWLEEFFISLNLDTDIYSGVQQGDNGQSLMLGGVDAAGNDSYNLLSKMCLEASCELALIDPKINLRVHKDTPFEVYKLATQLTKKGLGFPQYSNDDIVIPGLVKLEYDIEDARDYAVAACWEFLIPGWGMEPVNIDEMRFLNIIDHCLHNDLSHCQTFDEFFATLTRRMEERLTAIGDKHKDFKVLPSPLQSLLSYQAIDCGVDISKCSKYKNLGIHGPGIANAVDSLLVIKKLIYDEKVLSAEELISAIDANFEGYDVLLKKVRFSVPKYGTNDDEADNMAVKLIDRYAEVLGSQVNPIGGRYRPGTGSAMFYYWAVEDLGASPDGRLSGQPLSANFSPAIGTRPKGPISIVNSFTKPDLTKVVNGGPLTLEVHDTVFRSDEGIEKVAKLVKYFISRGGHQLQLNAINKDTLLDAQENPQNYESLIVRVWGWSGYFVQLDRKYQNHIINRVELLV